MRRPPRIHAHTRTDALLDSASVWIPWWRHQIETFAALLAICVRNSPVPAEFTAQRPVTRNFDVFFDLRLNKRLSKQSRGWWFEMPSRPSWYYCNAASRNILPLWGDNPTVHRAAISLSGMISLTKRHHAISVLVNNASRMLRDVRLPLKLTSDIYIHIYSTMTVYFLLQSVTTHFIISPLNSSPLGQNGCHVAHTIFMCIFLNKNFFCFD